MGLSLQAFPFSHYSQLTDPLFPWKISEDKASLQLSSHFDWKKKKKNHYKYWSVQKTYVTFTIFDWAPWEESRQNSPDRNLSRGRRSKFGRKYCVNGELHHPSERLIYKRYVRTFKPGMIYDYTPFLWFYFIKFPLSYYFPHVLSFRLLEKSLLKPVLSHTKQSLNPPVVYCTTCTVLYHCVSSSNWLWRCTCLECGRVLPDKHGGSY